MAAGCRLDAGFCAAVGTNLLRYQLAEKASAQGTLRLAHGVIPHDPSKERGGTLGGSTSHPVQLSFFRSV